MPTWSSVNKLPMNTHGRATRSFPKAFLRKNSDEKDIFNHFTKTRWSGDFRGLVRARTIKRRLAQAQACAGLRERARACASVRGLDSCPRLRVRDRDEYRREILQRKLRERTAERWHPWRWTRVQTSTCKSTSTRTRCDFFFSMVRSVWVFDVGHVVVCC